jgi:hypothetical protein
MFLIFFGRRPDDYAGVPKARTSHVTFPVYSRFTGTGASPRSLPRLRAIVLMARGLVDPCPLPVMKDSIGNLFLARERIRRIIHCHCEKKDTS